MTMHDKYATHIEICEFSIYYNESSKNIVVTNIGDLLIKILLSVEHDLNLIIVLLLV